MPTRGAVTEHGGAVVVRLLVEQCKAGGGHHGSTDVLGREQTGGFKGDRHFRTGRDQRHVAAAIRRDDEIGAPRDAVSTAGIAAERWQRLPRQAQDGGSMLGFERAIPGFQRLDGIGRTEHQEVRNDAQRREMLHGLMRRAVLAKPDGVVGHHMNDAQPHQGRKTDGRSAVVGEGEEGAAIGDEATMQREAVHRRGHSVLADTVMDVVPREMSARDGSLWFRVRQVRMVQVRGAADEVQELFRRCSRALAARPAASRASDVRWQSARVISPRPGQRLRQGNGLSPR